ncbi:MAG: TetR/AcrR family transcriptional regulator [Actinomycetota bacterium]|nr:TetR/AcrR family transcriptional regulator [Actinomycetota bacterium]
MDAALTVVEREGVAGLNMRAVADQVGAGAATLYWHLGRKDELIELVIDRVFGLIELPPPEPPRWQEQLKQVAIEARQVLRRYPGVGALTLGRIPTGPAILGWMEWSLGLLRAAGIPDHVAAYTGDLFGLYLGATSYEDTSPMVSPTGDELPPEEIVAIVRTFFQALPVDRFPNIHAVGDRLTEGSPDERFELGLEVILRGLASYRERPLPR